MNNFTTSKQKLNLLTGASGFLGESILKHSNIDFIKLGRSNLSDIKCNLCNEIPKVYNIDLVVHAAGMAHSVPKSLIEKQAFFDTNVIGTTNLLKGLEKNQLPKRFVFISSVAVYGKYSGLGINEEEHLLAKDPYGLSKIKAEQIVINWCNKNNVICTVLRLPLLIGKNPPGNLGAMINGIQKGYYFNIAGGQARKSMVLAEDVAKIILKASEIGGVYNLTDGYHPSFYELSIAISKQCQNSRIFNLPFFIAKCIALVGDAIGIMFPINSKKLQKITSDLTFDDSRARLFLGWNPSNVLDYYNK